MPRVSAARHHRHAALSSVMAAWQVATLIAAFIVFAAPRPALAQAEPAAPRPAGAETRSAQPASGESPSSGANAITQAAVRTGVLSCSSRINQVTNFVGGGAPTGAVLFAPPTQPDQRLMAVAMEVGNGKAYSYVSASFAPNQANGCGATYDAVTWWPEGCEVVAARQFSALKKIGQLQRNVTVLDGGLATKVFLMPAGKGCVSIKKEVVL